VLFNFIGCPQSGKTTTAAMAFAGLKEVGMISEFITEQARFYIAQRKLQFGLTPEDPLQLSDEDQVAIMTRQVEWDETFVRACGPDVMIVSDSSPLNSMLYMSPASRQSPQVIALKERSLAITHHSFYSRPIPRPATTLADPNRVHSFEQSLEIDSWIPELLKLVPSLPVTEVCGTTVDRVRTVQDTFLKSVSSAPKASVTNEAPSRRADS
jgi:hypothetical protein